MAKSGRYKDLQCRDEGATPSLAPHFSIIRLKAKIPAFQAGDAVSRSAWWSKSGWQAIRLTERTCRESVPSYQGVAQLAERVLWEHEAGSSNLFTLTSTGL